MTREICCAVIALVPGGEPMTLMDLASTCSAAGLAKFKIPEKLEFLPAIPRSAMGKVQRAQVMGGKPT